MNRRDVLEAIGGFLAGLSLSGCKVQKRTADTVLRVAHITDVHLSPGNASESGFPKCLKGIHGLEDKPDLIINGGDSIGDAWHTTKDEAVKQWDLWNKIIKKECSIPIEHCLGNHDVWNADAKAGKQLAMDHLNLGERYRSFDKGGWHFIVLDSIAVQKDGKYKGGLDDEQFEWLAQDLKDTPAKTPVLVLSHIPILAVCTFFDGKNEETGAWNIPTGWMHVDARRIKDLFHKYPNVKVCLSGHIHLWDRVEYNGVTYICDGAVCGKWWDGAYQETKRGYGLLDLKADGNFAYQYVNW